VGLDSGRERGIGAAEFENQGWQLYKWSPTVTPGHNKPHQPATKALVMPRVYEIEGLWIRK